MCVACAKSAKEVRHKKGVMGFIFLILALTINSVVLADQPDDIDDRKKRLKQGIMWGGAVVGVIVGWQVLKYADYKLFQEIRRFSERIARKSRMQLSRHTKVDITDPSIYQLTAPDGSQHHILGTMHISNLSLSDFPDDSKLWPILEQANILIPERDLLKDRFTTALLWKVSVKKMRSVRFGKQQKLSEQLGEPHWQKLRQMIAEKPDLKPVEQSLDEFMAEIDASTANDVYLQLDDYGIEYASGPFANSLTMDHQLVRYARKQGKKLIGLETQEQIFLAHLKATKSIVYDVYDLRQLIDEGGIDDVANKLTDDINRYAKGRSTEDRTTAPDYDDITLDQRNIAWVESEKIQKNCVNGNKCLIFVGRAHLTGGGNTLIKLLKEQGYMIERI